MDRQPPLEHRLVPDRLPLSRIQRIDAFEQPLDRRLRRRDLDLLVERKALFAEAARQSQRQALAPELQRRCRLRKVVQRPRERGIDRQRAGDADAHEQLARVHEPCIHAAQAADALQAAVALLPLPAAPGAERDHGLQPLEPSVLCDEQNTRLHLPADRRTSRGTLLRADEQRAERIDDAVRIRAAVRYDDLGCQLLRDRLIEHAAEIVQLLFLKDKLHRLPSFLFWENHMRAARAIFADYRRRARQSPATRSAMPSTTSTNSELNSSESSSPAPSAIITEPKSSIFLHIKNRPLPAYAQRAVLCRKIGQQRVPHRKKSIYPSCLHDLHVNASEQKRKHADAPPDQSDPIGSAAASIFQEATAPTGSPLALLLQQAIRTPFSKQLTAPHKKRQRHRPSAAPAE